MRMMEEKLEKLLDMVVWEQQCLLNLQLDDPLLL